MERKADVEHFRRSKRAKVLNVIVTVAIVRFTQRKILNNIYKTILKSVSIFNYESANVW